jgi:hypothetical protein
MAGRAGRNEGAKEGGGPGARPGPPTGRRAGRQDADGRGDTQQLGPTTAAPRAKRARPPPAHHYWRSEGKGAPATDGQGATTAEAWKSGDARGPALGPRGRTPRPREVSPTEGPFV